MSVWDWLSSIERFRCGVARQLHLSEESAESSDERALTRWDRVANALSAAGSVTTATGVSQAPIEDADAFRKATESILQRVADTTGAVFLGRAGMVVLGGRADVLCVRLDGPIEARIAQAVGDFDQARREIEAAKGGFTALGDRYGVARSLAALGSAAVHEGRVGEALPLLRESVALALTLGDRDDIAWALQLLAVAISESHSERAVRLLGAAEVLREALGARLEGIELALHEQTLATLESRSDPETLGRARASGRNLSLEEAVDLALTEN